MNPKLKPLYTAIFLISSAVCSTMLLNPVYAEGLGASYVQLGLMGAFHSLGYTVMTILVGLLLDRFEKIRLYIVFNLVTSAVIGLFAFTNIVDHIILLRLCFGFFSGTFWVSSSSITASLSEPHELTRSISYYNLSWIAGSAVGPFMGGFISDWFGFNVLFLFEAAITAVGVAVFAFTLGSNVKLQGSKTKFKIDWGAFRNVGVAYLCLFPYTLSSGIYFSMLPGYMRELGITASIIGVLLTLSTITKATGFFGVERLVRWGTKKSIRVISVLLAISLAPIAYVSGAIGFAVPLALYGLSNGLLEPIVLNYIAHNTEPGSRSFTMSIYESIFGLGMMIGPIATGYISETYSAGVVYLLLAVASLAIIPFSVWLRD